MVVWLAPQMGVNTLRFGYITKKGMHHVMPKVREMRCHASFTIEGRENDELPEMAIAAARIRNLDMMKMATEIAP